MKPSFTASESERSRRSPRSSAALSHRPPRPSLMYRTTPAETVIGVPPIKLPSRHSPNCQYYPVLGQSFFRIRLHTADSLVLAANAEDPQIRGICATGRVTCRSATKIRYSSAGVGQEIGPSPIIHRQIRGRRAAHRCDLIHRHCSCARRRSGQAISRFRCGRAAFEDQARASMNH